MNKKIFLIIAVLLSLAFEALAQFSFGKPSTELIIEKTIRDAFVIVEQQYQLQEIKTGDYYGRNNQEEFGKVYSLGIMTRKGLVVGDQVVNPWYYDPNYDRYKEDKAYRPVLYVTNVRNSDGKSRRLDCDTSNRVDLKDSVFEYPCQADSTGIGMVEKSGNVDGWLLWAWISDENQINETTTLSYAIIQNKDFEMKEGAVLQPPQTVQNPVGCFFVVPTITQVGSITFDLCGVATKINREWVFKPVTQTWCGMEQDNKEDMEAEEAVEESTPEESAPEEDVLSPSKRNKRGKKK